MTDIELAIALKQTKEIEERARVQWAEHATTGEAMERDKALAVLRLASPLKRQLEEWVGARATRDVRSPL